jgi:hypothetical protein
LSIFTGKKLGDFFRSTNFRAARGNATFGNAKVVENFHDKNGAGAFVFRGEIFFKVRTAGILKNLVLSFS